jgi:hypothetical protein
MTAGYFRTIGLAALALAPCLALSGAALAQGSNYPVKTMNFDLWCQEQQHLDPDRCDKRLPGDEKDFEAYRSTIERYEIPYLQQKQNDIALDRGILNKDPVDNPTAQDAPSRSQTIDPRTPGR